MAKMNPFAKFEKSGKDKEPKGMKEGSPKEEAFDKKQMRFAKGGAVPDYQLSSGSADAKGFKADAYPQEKFDKIATSKAGLKGDKTFPASATGAKTGFKQSSTAVKGGTNAAPQGYARGGMVVIKGSAPANRTVREADGIAQRGKTRGTQFAQK